MSLKGLDPTGLSGFLTDSGCLTSVGLFTQKLCTYKLSREKLNQKTRIAIDSQPSLL